MEKHKFTDYSAPEPESTENEPEKSTKFDPNDAPLDFGNGATDNGTAQG